MLSLHFPFQIKFATPFVTRRFFESVSNFTEKISQKKGKKRKKEIKKKIFHQSKLKLMIRAANNYKI
jgi:hypothetical protein